MLWYLFLYFFLHLARKQTIRFIATSSAVCLKLFLIALNMNVRPDIKVVNSICHSSAVCLKVHLKSMWLIMSIAGGSMMTFLSFYFSCCLFHGVRIISLKTLHVLFLLVAFPVSKLLFSHFHSLLSKLTTSHSVYIFGFYCDGQCCVWITDLLCASLLLCRILPSVWNHLPTKTVWREKDSTKVQNIWGSPMESFYHGDLQLFLAVCCSSRCQSRFRLHLSYWQCASFSAYHHPSNTVELRGGWSELLLLSPFSTRKQGAVCFVS